ncbi:glycosyl hydrolase family 28 protein [Leeuwenhoekiella parthenopeia]|uniref:Glycoside hydrolase family 49 N-terminal domain-containing protein n=1 Tax=Leeuwenhoekiella parthenopeia TaxID=2890320 RepID=A0ABS8GMQ2_9FLAO|nr:glycosyl hydrolase family 28 protein [Leeuwenhoekiella parthenopeia]MCC4211257.1 hypothetical protein [Leeuwenhoekiella parthenopeia]
MKKILNLILLGCLMQLQAQIITYTPTENIIDNNPYIHPSKHYKVSLLQNGDKINDFTYCMKAQHNTNNSQNTAWSNFSFSGSVTVQVERLQDTVDFVQVLPRSANIQVKKENSNLISFTIDKPGHYSIEFERGTVIDYPLLLFANPLEKDIPDPADPDVVYFKPGLHEIGDRFEIKSNQTVYLAGGAYVIGQFFAENAKDITIKGRGILSGEVYQPRTHQHMISMQNAENIKVSGITMIHSPRYMIALRGKNHFFDNVKMMGWWFSTDGISAGEHTVVENCFFKVNDDAVKLYQSNTLVKNCVIWQLENGAPFMISWNGSSDFGGIEVRDIEIIRVEHHWDNENLAVVCAVHGGEANISNIKFENIVIDNSKWRIFHLVTRPNRWGRWNPKSGSLSNFEFKNFKYYGTPVIKNLIAGHDAQHPVFNMQFENIEIAGRQLTDLKKHFIIDPRFTKHITISQ